MAGSNRRRANGEGSIYKDRGRWRGALTWVDDSGAKHRRMVHGSTQAEVRAALDAQRVDLDRGLTPAAPTTLGAYLDGWLEAEKQHVRPSTWRERERHVRSYIKPQLGRIRLDRL